MLAHALTAFRLALAPLLAYWIAVPGPIADLGARLAFLLAIASDLLDGRVARRLGTASAAGRAFDHATDCAFVSMGLGALALSGRLPWLLPALVVVAFAQYALDSYGLKRAKELRMSTLGRANGVLYFVPLGLLLAGSEPLAAPARWLAWGLCVSTLASMIDRALALTSPRGAPDSPAARTEVRSPR